MRGRKIDNEYVSTFISKCVKEGIADSDKILECVNEEISKIDSQLSEQLKQIDCLKKTRCKLFDVKIALSK